MGKEEPITCTKVVQPLFTIRCQNESVLRAFTVTHGQDLAVSAIAGQSVRLGLPERDLVSAFQQINERRTLDIPEKMRGINEMIAGKEISVMFNDRNILALSRVVASNKKDFLNHGMCTNLGRQSDAVNTQRGLAS